MNANASPPGTGSAGGLLSQQYGQNYTGTINALTPFKNNYYNSLQTKAHATVWPGFQFRLRLYMVEGDRLRRQ